MDILEALERLKEGHALICVENRALIKFEDQIIYLWHPNWHSKLSVSDFIKTFKQNNFVLYQDEHVVDLEKDEEYYAWRHNYL